MSRRSITIKIDCEDKHCGDCYYICATKDAPPGRWLCGIFGECLLEQDEHGEELRCPACIKAEVREA